MTQIEIEKKLLKEFRFMKIKSTNIFSDGFDQTISLDDNDEAIISITKYKGILYYKVNEMILNTLEATIIIAKAFLKDLEADNDR